MGSKKEKAIINSLWNFFFLGSINENFHLYFFLVPPNPFSNILRTWTTLNCKLLTHHVFSALCFFNKPFFFFQKDLSNSAKWKYWIMYVMLNNILLDSRAPQTWLQNPNTLPFDWRWVQFFRCQLMRHPIIYYHMCMAFKCIV